MATERSGQRTVFYLLLTLGAVPLLVPFVWLLLSSVKQSDRVLTEEPEWLPWRVEHFILEDGEQVPVIIFDETRREDRGIVRVLPRDRDPARPFTWPESKLRVVTWRAAGPDEAQAHSITLLTLQGQPLAVARLGPPDGAGRVPVQSRPFESAECRRLGLPATQEYGIAVPPEHLITTRRLDFRFSNYVDIFRQEPQLLGYILNSLFLAALAIVGNVLSCGVVGYAFARLRFPGRNVLFMLVLATMMLPAQVTMIPLFVGWTKLGALDTYVPLTLPAFLAHSAFFIFLYRQFFLTLPLELDDAARVDGCGPLRRFWHIAFPLAKPAAVAVAVYTFMATWNDFLGPLLYLTSEERQPLALALYSFKTSFGAKQAHFVMAASALMTAPTLLLFLVAQRVFMRGVVVTGVKG